MEGVSSFKDIIDKMSTPNTKERDSESKCAVDFCIGMWRILVFVSLGLCIENVRN
jgi:hypothetical protein